MMKTYEDILDFNKQTLDLLVKSSSRMAGTMETMTKETMGFFGKSFEDAVEATKAMASCKTAADVMALQTKLSKDAWEQMMAQSKKIGEVQSELFRETVEPLTTHYKGALDSAMKTAA